MTQFQRVDLATGYSISRVINGCWQLTPDHGGGPGSERDAHSIFSELVDCGFSTFDCADIYTGVEQCLGRFRQKLTDPDAVQIHTKFVPDKATLNELTDRKIDAMIDRSRRRLGVDRLDLVQFHWWDYDVPGLDRMANRLVDAQQKEKIRLLGTTNFDAAHIQQLVDAGIPVVSLQSQYSLLDRRPERRMAAVVARTGVRLLPYGVLAGGFLSERYLDQPPPVRMNRSLTKYRLIINEAGGWSAFQNLLNVLSGVAEKHKATIDQVAARWVLDQPMVAAIILGTGSQSRARHNMDLAKLILDAVDRQAIDACLKGMPSPDGDMYDLERDVNGPHTRIIRTELNSQYPDNNPTDSDDPSQAA